MIDHANPVRRFGCRPVLSYRRRRIAGEIFVLVHVNIGHMDANEDIAARYQIPLTKGVPAVAVLDDRGNLLYSQKTGEFESMRHMQSGAVTDFLNRWRRPAA